MLAGAVRGGAGRGSGDGGRGGGGRSAGGTRERLPLLETECRFCNFKYCPGKKGGTAETCVVCSFKLKIPEATTVGARRFLENARATKFEKNLKSMKGVETDMKRTQAEAKAIYDPKGVSPLGSDTDESNAFELGNWADFHECDEEGFGEHGLYAATSALLT